MSSNQIKNKTGKQCTYEEIGQKLSISPQQVHKIEKEAFNKMIRKFATLPHQNIFTSILSISEYLGIGTDQIYKKLDKQNYNDLCVYVEDNYEKRIKGFERLKTIYEKLR